MRFSHEEIDDILEKFLEMCSKHPEICPHIWGEGTKEPVKLGEKEVTVHYHCKMCGAKKTEKVRIPKIR